uniref:Uncharacterized protein n=1 Tax=Panagrolaimus superbus TaxID=310955 RepID=A0A914YA87_9BILA
MSDDEIRIDLFINPRLYEVASIEDDDPPNSPTVSDEYPPSPVRSPIIEDHPVRSPILLSSQYLGNPSIAGNNSQFQQAQTHIQFNQQQYIFPIVPNFFQTPVGGVPQVHPFYVDPQSQGIAPYYYGFLPAIWPRNNQIPNEPPQRPPRNGSNPP